jgi:DnaK suppressor protein
MDYQELRERLIKERENTLNRLTWFESELGEPLTNNEEEDAFIIENEDNLINLSKIEKNKLKQIERALYKLDLGDYEFCDSCGDDIAPERLNALPYTLLCIDCAEEFENKKRK